MDAAASCGRGVCVGELEMVLVADRVHDCVLEGDDPSRRARGAMAAAGDSRRARRATTKERITGG